MTSGPDPGRWRRNVWALALIVFVAFVGFQFFSPFLPLYVEGALAWLAAGLLALGARELLSRGERGEP